MNKRGAKITEEQMMLLFEIIAVAIILIALLNFVFANTEPATFKVKWLANDLALMTDSALSSPGILVYSYVLDKQKFGDLLNFKAVIKESQAEAYFFSIKKKGEVSQVVPHTFTKSVQFAGTEATEFLYFWRYGKIFSAENEKPDKINYKEIDCRIKKQAETSLIKKKIAFSGNEQLVNILNQAFGPNYVIGKAEDNDLDLLVELNCGQPQIIITSPSQESQKLACLFAEKMQFGYESIKQEFYASEARNYAKLGLKCDPKEAAGIKSAIEELYG